MLGGLAIAAGVAVLGYAIVTRKEGAKEAEATQVGAADRTEAPDAKNEQREGPDFAPVGTIAGTKVAPGPVAGSVRTENVTAVGFEIEGEGCSDAYGNPLPCKELANRIKEAANSYAADLLF